MGLLIKGVDMSYCQEGIEYVALKDAGVKFTIIRAGIGTRTDSLLDNHVSGCTAHGIAYGFYWYSVADSVQAAKAEAVACLKAIAKYDRPKYPVFFDMEEQSQIDKLDSRTRTDMALAFCEEIERGGYPAGVYANPSWLECYYEKDRIVGKYDIWLAHWTNDPKYPSKYNYGQTIWQWGIDNIGMDIDGDICFINYPAKTDFWYKSHGITDKHDEPSKPTQPETTQPTTDLRCGDEVALKNAPLYGSSTSKNKANTISGTYWVHSDGIINGRIRITTPKGCTDCTGWVDVVDCNVPTKKIAIGDKVTVKSGAKFSNGVVPAAFVYKTTFDIQNISRDGKEALIGIDGKATGWMFIKDLVIV